MINLFKYRKLGIIILIAMIVSFLLTLAALWNFLLQFEAKNAGWIVFFFVLLMGSGVAMFLIVYRISDQEKLDVYIQSVLENEKNLMKAEHQDKKEIVDVEEEVGEIEVEESVNKILTALNGKSTKDICNQLLRGLSKQLGFNQGIIYLRDKKSKTFIPEGTYALTDQNPEPFIIGESLMGQAVESKSLIRINDIPEKYFDVSSGLGNSKPKNLFFLPIVYKNQSIALIELGSFHKPSETIEKTLNKLSTEAGKIIFNCISN